MATAPALRRTSDRLLAAASELFARQGLHGASIRDIAELAGTNVASGHYHFGSKEALYLEVFRAEFARVGERLTARGLRKAPAILRRASRRELAAILEARILAVLELLLGPPPGPHGALMQRELCDPSPALPIIVSEFIRPQSDDMEALLMALAPRADRETIRLASFSIFGQLLFYRFNMPAILLVLGRSSYPRGFPRKIARHIARFSLAGLDAVAGRRTERRRAS
jgi:AcrR family transcriptional regulator